MAVAIAVSFRVEAAYEPARFPAGDPSHLPGAFRKPEGREEGQDTAAERGAVGAYDKLGFGTVGQVSYRDATCAEADRFVKNKGGNVIKLGIGGIPCGIEARDKRWTGVRLPARVTIEGRNYCWFRLAGRPCFRDPQIIISDPPIPC